MPRNCIGLLHPLSGVIPSNKGCRALGSLNTSARQEKYSLPITLQGHAELFAPGIKTIPVWRIRVVMIERTMTMQRSFSDLEYAAKKKVTRHERFPGEIDAVTPWPALLAEVEPFYPKGKGRGQPPAHALLHGEETTVFGDAGYQGGEKREGNQDSKATWHVTCGQASAVRHRTARAGDCVSGPSNSRPANGDQTDR